MNIARKNAIITGASSGIGRSISVQLAKNGVNVALIGRSLEGLNETAAMLPEGSKYICYSGDLRLEEDSINGVNHVVNQWGSLDYLINCAGVSQRSSYKVEEIETEDFKKIMDTNLDSLLFCSREAIPHLKKSQDAYIINILSTAAFSTGAGGGMYSASKYAARALHESMVASYKGSNIRVSAVSPGPVHTNIWSHKTEEITQKRKDGMLQPNNIADIVLFLLKLEPNVHIGNITVEPWFYKKS